MRGGAFLKGKEGRVGFRKKSPKYFLEKFHLVFERTFKVLQYLMFRILFRKISVFRRNAPIFPRESSSIEIPPSGLLFKLSLTEALKEIATSISKQARPNDEHTIYISLYYVHYINYSKIGLLGSIPEK